MSNRILIVGDAGRGKTTFAKKLSAKLNIPSYETDDFYWKTKFTEPAIRQESIKEIAKVYAQEKWIVDGSTRHLIQDAFEKADVIYYLKFNSIVAQYYFLFMRNLEREYESFLDLLRFYKHITYKKFRKGYRNDLPSLEIMLAPYESKVIRLYTLKEIDAELDRV